MCKVAGKDGKVLIIYWNADRFPDAVRNFYGKNPQLCGKFTEEDIDFENTTLRTPRQFSTISIYTHPLK
jgi:hypothetical protein